MTDKDFQLRSERRIAEVAASSPENRARVTLYDAKLRSLRNSHACLMRLPAHEASRVCHVAIHADVVGHCAQRHTNALGITFYKYIK